MAAVKRTITRWAIHEQGTEQFGYLCSFKSEADNMFENLFKNTFNISPEEKAKYQVVEVEVSWIENEKEEGDTLQ